jgi:hypothetical protein
MLNRARKGCSTVRPIRMDTKGPGDPGDLVGQSNDGFIPVGALLEFVQPDSKSVSTAMQMEHARACSVDQQPAQIAVTLLLMLSRVSFPPVECCRGTSPSHAAKSRPRRNRRASPTAARRAVAPRGPMPGIVIKRRAVSSAAARSSISRDAASSCDPPRLNVASRLCD